MDIVNKFYFWLVLLFHLNKNKALDLKQAVAALSFLQGDLCQRVLI